MVSSDMSDPGFPCVSKSPHYEISVLEEIKFTLSSPVTQELRVEDSMRNKEIQ